MRKIFILICIGVIGLLSLIPALTQNNIMHFRIAHFSPDAPAVDVYVDGEVALSDVTFPTVSEWLEIEQGNYVIAVAPAGTSIEEAVIGPATFNLVAGTWVTVHAIGSVENNTLTSSIIIEDYRPLTEAGFARISVLHAIEGAPELNLMSNGNELLNRLAYPGSQGSNDGFFTREIPAGSADLSFVLTSDPETAVVGQANVEIEANMNYLMAVVGTVDAPQLVIVSTPLDGGMEMSGDNTMDEDITSDTIADIVIASAEDESPQFTILLDAIQAADPAILDLLSDPSANLTVFAPTDQAFMKLLDAMQTDAESLFADSDTLTAVLQYHVLNGAVMEADALALDGQSVPTLLSDNATIALRNVTEELVLNDMVYVITPDVQAVNGIIHVVDSVLVPVLVTGEPTSVPTPTQVPTQTLQPTPTPTLQPTATPTIMPTQTVVATETIDPIVLTLDPSPTGVPTEVMAEDDMMSEGQLLWERMVETTDLIGTDPMDMDDMDEASDESMDSDGMSNTIADIVMVSASADDPQFTILLEAVQAADPSILEALSNPDVELTVFAPTDGAFEAFFTDMGMSAEELLANTNLLNDVLQYHVVDGAVLADAVLTMDGNAVPTLLGEDATVSVSVDGDTVMLNDTVSVVVTDFLADNGVVHVIDGVLIPADG